MSRYLYRVDLAKPTRTVTPAQLRAVGKTLRTPRTYTTRRIVRPYFIPRSLGECLDCAPEG